MRWALGFIVMVVGLGFAAVVYLGTLQPVAFGSREGLGQVRLMGVDDDVSDDVVRDGVDRIATYQYAPDARFAVMLSVRNTSPLPVVLTAQGDPPADIEHTFGFWLEDLAANLSEGYGDDTGVLDQPPMEPTTIEPDGELAVWARFRISPTCQDPIPLKPAFDWPDTEGLASTTMDTIALRTQTFGVGQTTLVELPFELQVVNGGPDALTRCPGLL